MSLYRNRKCSANAQANHSFGRLWTAWTYSSSLYVGKKKEKKIVSYRKKGSFKVLIRVAMRVALHLLCALAHLAPGGE